MTTDSFDGHFTPQHKATSDYHYLSFHVPEGVTRIDVQYDFTRTGHASRKAGHENVIDIGLFDPRGHNFNGDGFRGWSGGHRAEFTVGLTEATPGYLPGPIPAGTWHIILGLYKIAPEGCDYNITVTFSQGTHAPPPHPHTSTLPHLHTPTPPAQQISIAHAQSRWFRGDLHSHTHHSDAEASVSEIVDVARTRGLDFLAITDHNTVSHLPELPTHGGPDLLLIPGMEVTTYYGHANVWGLSQWLDFRCRDAGAMQRIMKTAHAQGALFGLNHPHSLIGGLWEYGWLEGADIIEIYNTRWLHFNYQALTWWDELLQEGKRIVAVGGSDRHQSRDFDPLFPLQVGIPTTWVYAESLSVNAILAGIRAGHVFVSNDVDGPQIRLTARSPNGQTAIMGDTLELPVGTSVVVECEVHGARGHVLELVQDGQVVDRRALEDQEVRMTWTVPGEGDGYVRAQVIASTSGGRAEPAYPLMRALTNPIYFEVK